MPSRRVLIALLVAALGGYSMIRHVRQMLHEGISLEDGGGWTALFLTEFLVTMSALVVASS